MRRILGNRFFRGGLIVGAVLVVGITVFAYFSAGEIYDYTDTVDGVHLPQVDAIVCLAGGRGRIAAAGDLWYRYWEMAQVPEKNPGRSPSPRTTPILYISGMGKQSNWNVLARQVRRGVLEVLRPSDVILETESSNTEQNASWLAHYAMEHGWERVLLMTSRYHMKRARYIFDRVFKKADPAIAIETLSIYQEPFEPGEWRSGLHGIHVTTVEYLKWLYYKLFWRV